MRKPYPRTFRSIALATLLSTVAVSCSHARYTFLRDDQLPVMSPCKATVEGKEPCAAYLKTADGRRLCVGGPGASPEVAGFVQFLQEGQVYVFPDTFLEYQKRQRGSREPRLD
jgi:hypothetical protein